MGTKASMIDSMPSRTRRLWPLLVILLAVPTLGISGCESSDPSGPTAEPPSLLDAEERNAGWWIEQYGEISLADLDGEDAEIFKATHGILDRLRPHFDDARTRLVILGAEIDNDAPLPAFAAALPDDTIVMSLEGLRLCYRSVTREAGDSRAAAVLAHELAHLVAEHHWHLEAAALVGGFSGESDVFRSLLKTLGSNSQQAKKLELAADRRAVIGMAMAGYDPEVLLSGESSFFHEWVGTASGQLAYQNDSHPTSDERALYAKSWFRNAADLAALFQEGVRAYDEGDFTGAAEAFERVEREFPSREVLSNLGLAEIQLAARALGTCNGSLLLRWRLPMEIDRTTLLERTILRGDERSGCYEEEPYGAHRRSAHTALDEALRKEETYHPALLNLVALYMLDDRPQLAMGLAESGVSLYPDDPDFLLAYKTAEISVLMELEKPVENELSDLGDLHRRFPDHPDIAFNYAQALSHAGQYDRAEPVWRAFLRLEPESEWAEIARWNLGEEPESAANEDQPAR